MDACNVLSKVYGASSSPCPSLSLQDYPVMLPLPHPCKEGEKQNPQNPQGCVATPVSTPVRLCCVYLVLWSPGDPAATAAASVAASSAALAVRCCESGFLLLVCKSLNQACISFFGQMIFSVSVSALAAL